MFKKKWMVFVAATVLAVSVFAGCGAKETPDEGEVTTGAEPTTEVQAEQESDFELKYPSHMEEYG